jgi:hypothetical protein
MICHHAWDKRASAALVALGVTTWEELSALSEWQILTTKGVGLKTLRYIQGQMRERGLTLRATKRSIPEQLRIGRTEAVRCVYFIACDGFVKIGHTKDIRKRFQGISLANPRPCELLAIVRTSDEQESRHIEKSLHARFAVHRHRLEWFRHTPDIHAYIGTVNGQGTH